MNRGSKIPTVCLELFNNKASTPGWKFIVHSILKLLPFSQHLIELFFTVITVTQWPCGDPFQCVSLLEINGARVTHLAQRPLCQLSL